MKCQLCFRELDRDARAGTRFCSAACRARAFRSKGRRGGAQAGPPLDSTPAAAATTPRSRKTAIDFPRISMRRQVRRQAPEGAVGYRLVLPLPGGLQPQLLPQPKAPGEASVWRIDPFELPDDLRFEDGRLYRLVFVDAQGLVMRTTKSYFPALRFFIGPPDRSADRARTQDDELLRHIRDPVERSQCARDLVRLSILQREYRQAVASQRQAKQMHEEVRKNAETIRKQSEAIAEQRQRQDEANAYKREKWLVPLLGIAIPVMGALGIWLGPRVQEHLKRLTELVELPAMTEQERNALLQEAATLLKQLPQKTPEPPSPAPPQPASEGSSGASGTTAVAPPGAPSEEKLIAQSSRPIPDTASIQNKVEPGAPIAMPQAPFVKSEFHEAPPVSHSTPNDPSQSVQSAATSSASGSLENHSCVPECSPPLTSTEVETICGILLDAEKLVLWLHEMRTVTAQQPGQAVPATPVLQLGGDEYKQIRRYVQDERLRVAASQLFMTFTELYQADINNLFKLPPPFQSINQSKAHEFLQFIKSEVRRPYAYALFRRWSELNAGRPAFPLPSTNLPDKEQKHIRKNLRDVRTQFWVASQMQSSAG